MKRTVLCAASVVLLSACQTPPNTPSQQPEVTLYGVDASCVRNGFLNGLVDQGFQIKTTNDTQIVAGRPTKNVGAQLMFSTNYGGSPEERLTLLFLNTNSGGLRVVASAAYVSNAGTGFEKITPMTFSQKDQTEMEALGARAKQTCSK